MATEVKKPELLIATPELLQRLSSYPAVVGDRPISDERIGFLLTSIGRNGMRTFVIAVAKLGGQWFSVDGKHSRELLLRHPELLARRPRILLEKFTCDTFYDLARLAISYNSSISVKSPRSMNGIMASGADEEIREKLMASPAIGSTITSVDAAVVYHRYGIKGWSVCKGVDRAEAIAEPQAASFLKWVLVLEETTRKEFGVKLGWRVIGRSFLMAAMLCQWEVSPEFARLYWLAIACGKGLLGNAERLRAYLISTTVVAGRPPAKRDGKRGVREMETAQEAFARAMRSWNVVCSEKPGVRFDIPTDLADPLYEMRKPTLVPPGPRLTHEKFLSLVASGQEHLLDLV